jgi:hypothetical protein
LSRRLQADGGAVGVGLGAGQVDADGGDRGGGALDGRLDRLGVIAEEAELPVPA